jgi:hypothetical protein
MRLQDIVARFMLPPRPKAVQDMAWLQRIPPADAPPGCSSLFGTHVATNKACPFSYLADAVLEPMASDEGHVYLNARAIHRDPRGWNRPNEFLIDRWLPGGQHDTEPERRLFIRTRRPQLRGRLVRVDDSRDVSAEGAVAAGGDQPVRGRAADRRRITRRPASPVQIAFR